jgi:hypothetical protein
MPPKSANVRKVLATLQENPQLVRQLNQVLTKIYAKAGVTLTLDEKAELFSAFASLIKNESKFIIIALGPTPPPKA